MGRALLRFASAYTMSRRAVSRGTGPTRTSDRWVRRRIRRPNQFTEVQREIVELEPAGAAQRWFQSQALQLTNRLSDLRWLVMNQQTATMPLLPVFALIFLSSMAIFGSFSLYVRPNATVLTVISLTALAIAGATFLIVEMNNPFHGLMYISSKGAHEVMHVLGP